MSVQIDANEGLVATLLRRGSELVGAASGGAIGFLAAGPIGAGTSAAFGTLVGQALGDVANQYLSSRESIRVGAVGSLAIDEVRRRLEKGDSIRTDNFFDQNISAQAPGYELFEGVITKAKNTYEEKKLPYLAKLFSNISFDPTCSGLEANFLIALTDQLTYTQLSLLSLFARENDFNLRSTEFETVASPSHKQHSLLQQTHDLFKKNLLIQQELGQDGGVFMMDLSGILPAHVQLTAEGRRVFSLLDLKDIPLSELRGISAYL